MLDPTALPLAHDLHHGALYWLEPGILVAVPDDGVLETVEDSKAVYAGCTRCSEEFGGPIGVVVFVDRLQGQTGEVREYWATVMQPEVVCAAALVCTSFFARAVGSFFMRIRKPTVPTRMCSSVEEAAAWARDRVGPQMMIGPEA